MAVVVVTVPARDQIRDALAWWREHRPAAPRLLASELRAALRRLADFPRAAQRARGRLEIRRVVLPRVGYVVLYRLRAPDLVEVLALRHGARDDT